MNKVIKFSLDTKFNNTNSSIKDIKKQLEDIQIPVIH